MEEKSSTQKVCSFYVSNIHFATMILPFLSKNVEEKTNIITFFENNYTTNIELVLSRLTLTEERKKEILKINWKDTNVTKYLNVERILKNKLDKTNKNIVIVNGREEYINTINECIDVYLERTKKKINARKIKVMNFYEVSSFNDNVKDILDKHDMIFNTAGEHKIEEIFDGYKKIETKVNI